MKLARRDLAQVAAGVVLINALSSHVAGCERCRRVVEAGTRPNNLCPTGFGALRQLTESTLSVLEVVEAVRAMGGVVWRVDGDGTLVGTDTGGDDGD